MPGTPVPSVSCTVTSITPGVLGSQNGSLSVRRKFPAGVGVNCSGTAVEGVKVGPSVGVGVLLAGGIKVGVAVEIDGVGSGVLVYNGMMMDAQLCTPWLCASSTMLRTVEIPVLVLTKLLRASSQAASARFCQVWSPRRNCTRRSTA